MKKFKKATQIETYENYMALEGDARDEWYNEQGSKGPYIIDYRVIREPMIRVETADGKYFDYSDRDPYMVRAVHKESAKLFDDEFCREEFSEKLRTAMLEENVTARELMELTGIAPSRIEKLWKGIISPSIVEVAKIATALGKYPGDLLDCM